MRNKNKRKLIFLNFNYAHNVKTPTACFWFDCDIYLYT